MSSAGPAIYISLVAEATFDGGGGARASVCYTEALHQGLWRAEDQPERLFPLPELLNHQQKYYYSSH